VKYKVGEKLDRIQKFVPTICDDAQRPHQNVSFLSGVRLYHI